MIRFGAANNFLRFDSFHFLSAESKPNTSISGPWAICIKVFSLNADCLFLDETLISFWILNPLSTVAVCYSVVVQAKLLTQVLTGLEKCQGDLQSEVSMLTVQYDMDKVLLRIYEMGMVL